jgi:AcrR family transcriptional regulator
MPAKTAKRSYNSSRRTLQAAQTREEVLRAASRLFRNTGWAGTTLAAIAEEAGVSVETIYKGFGSKKALLREAMDVAVVGDTDPIPFVERPEFASLAEGTIAERTARGIGVVTDIHERSAGIWQAIVEAASSDPEVDEWRRAGEAARRSDVHRSLELMLGGEVDDAVVTLLWVLYSPEIYRKLVVDEGLSRAAYEELLIDASRRITGT